MGALRETKVQNNFARRYLRFKRTENAPFEARRGTVTLREMMFNPREETQSAKYLGD